MSTNRREMNKIARDQREKMEEEIKALKNDLQNVKSLLEKVIKNKDEKKENGRKYTKIIDEDEPALKIDPRRSNEQIKRFHRTRGSIQEYEVPALRQVAKVGKQLIFLTLQ